MVNMADTNNQSDLKNARKVAVELESNRAKLESELREWLSILETNNVGMNEPLIDDDGYPRADVDVYQVRHARHKIICIRNDLKQAMQEIEKQLHLIHSLSKDSGGNKMEVDVNPDHAFARISSVAINSPADEAGLKVNDLVVTFGSINSSNLQSLTDVASLVRNSKNEYIKLTVLRNNVPTNVYLKPHEWSGTGLLGCVIVPIEDVER